MAFDQDTSALLEQAFSATTDRFVLLPCESGSCMGAGMCIHFDDCKMGGVVNLRRSDQVVEPDESVWCYEADDGSWSEVDIYSSSTLNAFRRSGRSTMVLHGPFGSYRIEWPSVTRAANSNASGVEMQQCNVVTGKRRRLMPRADIFKEAPAHSHTFVPYDDKDADAAPDNYKCPITRAVMVDPVVLADGHSYERHAIVKWLLQHNKSPKMGADLQDKHVTPNHSMRSVIQDDMAARKATRDLRVFVTTDGVDDAWRNCLPPQGGN